MKSATKRFGRLVVEPEAGPPLVDLALAQDADLVGHGEGLELVVGDQDGGDPVALEHAPGPRGRVARAAPRPCWRRARPAAGSPGAGPWPGPGRPAAACRPRADGDTAGPHRPDPPAPAAPRPGAATLGRWRRLAARSRCCAPPSGGERGRSPGRPCPPAALRGQGLRRAPRPAGRGVRISPAVTGSNPAMARSRVVLPQPLGPSRQPMTPVLEDEGDLAHHGVAAVGDGDVADLKL